MHTRTVIAMETIRALATEASFKSHTRRSIFTRSCLARGLLCYLFYDSSCNAIENFADQTIQKHDIMTYCKLFAHELAYT